MFTTPGVRPSPVLPSGASKRREGGRGQRHVAPPVRGGSGAAAGRGGGATAALRTAQPRDGWGEPRRGGSSLVPGGSASSTFASLQRREEEERAGWGGRLLSPLFPPFPSALHSLPSLRPPFLAFPPSAPCGCPARCAPWRGQRPRGGGARAVGRCCCCCQHCWRAGRPARRRRCPQLKSLRTAASSASSGVSCPRAARGPCVPETSCATTTSAPSPTAPASTPGMAQARCPAGFGWAL